MQPEGGFFFELPENRDDIFESFKMVPRNILPKLRQVTGVADQRSFVSLLQYRERSTATTEAVNISGAKTPLPISPRRKEPHPPLSVMPTRMLLRSLMITWILSSPRLVNLTIPIMQRISYSPSWFLNPDRNPILHGIVRGIFYDHFCAGENEKEVKETIGNIKKMRFEGVILGYARETLAHTSVDSKATAGSVSIEEAVERWKKGTLETLALIGPGDFLAIKLTGAGPVAIEAMTKGERPPPAILAAMTEICDQALSQNTRLWVDAEQQVFQRSIDAWTIDLMRKYNRNGKVLVYNTLQAYLKSTPKNIAHHLSLAQNEGWGIGIKLVRGAYIMIEERKLIHDKIEDTHEAYNNIVQNLLCRKFPGVSESKEFPHLQLFLASHNEESVRRGYETWKERMQTGLPTIKLEIGQLQGMADEVSCGLVQIRQRMSTASMTALDVEKEWYPRAFKCLCWGRTRECVQFLVRRVVENRGSLDRTKVWLAGLKRELWRRIKTSIRLG